MTAPERGRGRKRERETAESRPPRWVQREAWTGPDTTNRVRPLALSPVSTVQFPPGFTAANRLTLPNRLTPPSVYPRQHPSTINPPTSTLASGRHSPPVVEPVCESTTAEIYQNRPLQASHRTPRIDQPVKILHCSQSSYYPNIGNPVS